MNTLIDKIKNNTYECNILLQCHNKNIKELFESLKTNSYITSLYLNYINDEGIIYLCKLLKVNSSIIYLNLYNNNIQ